MPPELYGKCRELGYCDCGGFFGCVDDAFGTQPKPKATGQPESCGYCRRKGSACVKHGGGPSYKPSKKTKVTITQRNGKVEVDQLPQDAVDKMRYGVNHDAPEASDKIAEIEFNKNADFKDRLEQRDEPIAKIVHKTIETPEVPEDYVPITPLDRAEELKQKIADNTKPPVQRPLTTFIIPTIGRETLGRSLASVGCNPALVRYDHDRRGEGSLRNSMIREAETEWVSFLDDDDSVTADYVDRLREAIAQAPNADVVLFRQYWLDGTIIPKTPDVAWGNIGIGFSVRRSVALSHPFHDEPHEDLRFIERLAELDDIEIAFSPYIVYRVRH